MNSESAKREWANPRTIGLMVCFVCLAASTCSGRKSSVQLACLVSIGTVSGLIAFGGANFPGASLDRYQRKKPWYTAFCSSDGLFLAAEQSAMRVNARIANDIRPALTSTLQPSSEIGRAHV